MRGKRRLPGNSRIRRGVFAAPQTAAEGAPYNGAVRGLSAGGYSLARGRLPRQPAARARATLSFLRQKRLGRKSRQEGDPMNGRHRRTFMDRPTRVTFVQPVRLYARQAAAARGDSPRAIFLRRIRNVKSWRRISEFRRGLAYAAPSMSSAVTRNSPQIGVSRFRGAQLVARQPKPGAGQKRRVVNVQRGHAEQPSNRGVALQRRAACRAPAEARRGAETPRRQCPARSRARM